MKSETSCRLTQPQFYAACKALESMREFVLAECPTKINVARMIKEIVGFNVNVQNLGNITETTGIKWTAKPKAVAKADKPTKKRVSGTHHRSNVLKLALVVANLIQRLGDNVPQDLAEVIHYLQSREGV